MKKNDSNKTPTLWRIFYQTFILSMFTLGGGYVMISMMKERFVDKMGWLTADELTGLIALGQSSPGAMVVNVCVLMGYSIKGFGGAISALLGTALPPVIILAAIWRVYGIISSDPWVAAAFRGMRAGVAAVMADIVVTLAAPFFKKGSLVYVAVMAAAFLICYFLEVNVAFVVLGAAVLGIIIGAVGRRRAET